MEGIFLGMELLKRSRSWHSNRITWVSTEHEHQVAHLTTTITIFWWSVLYIACRTGRSSKRTVVGRTTFRIGSSLRFATHKWKGISKLMLWIVLWEFPDSVLSSRVWERCGRSYICMELFVMASLFKKQSLIYVIQFWCTGKSSGFIWKLLNNYRVAYLEEFVEGATQVTVSRCRWMFVYNRVLSCKNAMERTEYSVGTWKTGWWRTRDEEFT